MRTFSYKVLLLGALVAVSPVTEAQTSAPPSGHEVELVVTYTAERSNLVTNPILWRQGAAFSLSGELYRGFGVGMNINGSRVSNIAGTGINLTTVTTTFGPSYHWSPKSGRIAVFGEGLIGESHGLDSVFPSAGGAQQDYNSFALQVGGGLDLRTKGRFALRAIQADWIRTQFPNGTTNVQNSLRLGAGIVLRLQRTKR